MIYGDTNKDTFYQTRTINIYFKFENPPKKTKDAEKQVSFPSSGNETSSSWGRGNVKSQISFPAKKIEQKYARTSIHLKHKSVFLFVFCVFTMSS